jgi:hypothetical protein
MLGIQKLSIYGTIAILSTLLIMPTNYAQSAVDDRVVPREKELAATAPLKSQQATLGKVGPASQLAPTEQATQIKNFSATIPDNLPVLKYLGSLTAAGWSIAWSFNGPFRVDQSLSNIIGTDLLQEYRCLVQARQILQRGQRKIIIDAFQFGAADGAYGSYCAAHRGATSYAAQGDASSEDQESLSFCKNRYFVCLQGSEQDDDEAKSVINQLAKKIIERIDKEKGGNTHVQTVAYYPKPAIFNEMPSLGRVLGSEKLVAGPVSLKRFFPAAYSTNLLPLQKGAVADYKIEEPHRDRLKLLVAYYRSAQEAGMIYGRYVSTLRTQNKEKSVDGFSCPTSLFKVSDTFVLCQLRDQQIIVINGAKHKDTLSELAHEIYF